MAETDTQDAAPAAPFPTPAHEDIQHHEGHDPREDKHDAEEAPDEDLPHG